MSNDPLLSVHNLKKYFPLRRGVFLRSAGNVHAIDDITFHIKQGETLGLVGESGCGKSTVAKTVLKLIRPTAGQVCFEGRDIGELDRSELRALRREMQIILQDPSESLNARHTVGALLEEPFVIHGLGTSSDRKRWVKELLVQVGLQPDAIERFPHEFSGGQRQRIGIARAIALKPKLLICDEPVSALDVSVQSQILNLLLDLQQKMNLTLLFIAHDLAVVKHVSDRIAVMYLGKIVETADAQLLYRDAQHPYTQSLIASIPEPDPSLHQLPHALEGDVPSPIKPPSGCRFHTRCRFVQDKCKEVEPQLKTVNSTSEQPHEVACHFAGEVFL